MCLSICICVFSVTFSAGACSSQDWQHFVLASLVSQCKNQPWGQIHSIFSSFSPAADDWPFDQPININPNVIFDIVIGRFSSAMIKMNIRRDWLISSKRFPAMPPQNVLSRNTWNSVGVFLIMAGTKKAMMQRKYGWVLFSTPADTGLPTIHITKEKK